MSGYNPLLRKKKENEQYGQSPIYPNIQKYGLVPPKSEEKKFTNVNSRASPSHSKPLPTPPFKT